MAIPLDLHIPPSTSTVNVSIIDTGSFIGGMPMADFAEPAIPGHDNFEAPCYSFLIQHPTQNRTLIFDLGIKKDWQNWPPPLLEYLKLVGAEFHVPKDVRELLDEHGFDTKSIEAVAWSHFHFDHVGDLSTLEKGTKIIIGRGAKECVFPGYPTNPASMFREADVAGHEVEEMDFSSSLMKIGGLPAIDYFGDGSFYFLDSPGHCVGHMCGFARVTSNPDSFILMGGDAVHHGGELRPHPWHPLPASILPNPLDVMSSTPCPGAIFEPLLPHGREAPFYAPSTSESKVHFDVPTTIETIKKLQAADAHDNILIIPAHDATMRKVADFFPKTANDFMEKGWVQKTRWAWLADFANAVVKESKDEDIPRNLG